MRICLFDDYRLGIVDGDYVVDLTQVLPRHDPEWPWSFVPRFFRDFDELRAQITAQMPTAPRKPLSQVRLRPPVPAPFNVAAAASNYKAHQAEMDVYATEGRFTGGQQGRGLGYGTDVESGLPSVPGRPAGTRGEVFLKSATSIIGPNETILLPDTVPGKEVHHEGEFAAIIKREAYRVSRKDALDHVLGYTGLMDITVRGDGDRSRRKSYKTFTPVGPWITTRDEIPDPQNVAVKLWVNDELRQDANTSDQVESLAEVIEYASHCYPLMPGDIVTTGSPAGVGRIKEGDKVRLEVQGVGSFTVDVERV